MAAVIIDRFHGDRLMGEIIRNLQPIKIGNDELMIELNEGYKKSQGRVIHIQNKKFRYLFTEKDFLNLAATVLRAKSEMEYYKKSLIAGAEKTETDEHEAADEKTLQVLPYFKELFDKHRIDYRLVETGKGYVTFIINPKCRKLFQSKIAKAKGVKKSAHIYGKSFGYKFLYQMKPFDLYIYNGVCIEIYYQLPCMSLTPKTWIPLDKCLQIRTFEERQTDDNGMLQLDDISYYIYRLGWAIFKNNSIGKYEEKVFKEKAEVLKDDAFAACLKMVFFGYADRMIQLLKEEKYSEIFVDYCSYYEY